MRTSTRAALIVGAAALFAGCGGLQPPIGGQGAMPQSRSHPASSSYTVLYRFDRFPNGAHPVAGLTEYNGTLYGTASQGGTKGCHGKQGCGTVFSVTTSGGEHLLYSFTPFQQGTFPHSGLIDVKGTLYGTTEKGGGGGGTVYSVGPSGTETVLHSFHGGKSDGDTPLGGLTVVKHSFYGTTEDGGNSGAGTVYSISAAGAFVLLHHFKGTPDGSYPNGGLINVHGTLYGTTPFGGSGACNYGCGTVYRGVPIAAPTRARVPYMSIACFRRLFEFGRSYVVA